MMNEIIEQFKDVLIADGKATKTLESYIGDVVGFLEWLESKFGTPSAQDC